MIQNLCTCLQHVNVRVTICFSCSLHSAFCSGPPCETRGVDGEVGRAAACPSLINPLFDMNHTVFLLSHLKLMSVVSWFHYLHPGPGPRLLSSSECEFNPDQQPPPPPFAEQLTVITKRSEAERQWHDSPRYPYQGRMSLLITLLTQIFSGF